MDRTILNLVRLSMIGLDWDNLMWWVYMTNKSEETDVLISLLNDPPLSPSWFSSHFLLHIIRNSIIFWWLLSKAILLPKVQLPVVKTTSSSIEGASISTVDLTRSETPAATLQAPSISVSECSLQCCVLVELQNELNMLSKYVAEVDPELKEVTSIATVMDIMKKRETSHSVYWAVYSAETVPDHPVVKCHRRTEFFSSQESKNLLQKPPYTRTLESLPYAPLP